MDMMGHGGGYQFVVHKIRESVGVMSQGGGRKLEVSEIGKVWVLFGITGVYSPLLYWFQF